MTIELATSVMFLLSSFYGTATLSDVQLKPDEAKIAPITLEDHVKEYYKDDPILAEIARCESQYRQFGKSGQIIRGKVNSKDVGIMQINERYHADKSKELGFDIRTLEGNLAYAKWLYEKEGVKPWNSSLKCWSDGDNKVAINNSKNLTQNY